MAGIRLNTRLVSTTPNTNGNGKEDVIPNTAVPPLNPADAPGDGLPNAYAQDGSTDWSRSYSGLSQTAFPKEVADVLLADINPLDIEMKPGTLEKTRIDADSADTIPRWHDLSPGDQV